MHPLMGLCPPEPSIAVWCRAPPLLQPCQRWTRSSKLIAPSNPRRRLAPLTAADTKVVANAGSRIRPQGCPIVLVGARVGRRSRRLASEHDACEEVGPWRLH
jgi:hypothetical protein